MMKIIIRNIFFAVLAALILAGCRDDIFGTQNPRTQYHIYNWSQLFDAYWKGMNNNYAFWDIDPTDWDAVYDEYKPQFDALVSAGFADSIVNKNAFKLFEELTADLIDGHYGCTFNIPRVDTSAYQTWKIRPSSVRNSSRPGYHDIWTTQNQQIKILRELKSEGRFYPANGYQYGATANQPFVYFSGILDNDIVYLKFNEFITSTQIGTGNAIDGIYNDYNNFLDNWPDVKGVIIDVRCNDGGYLNDFSLLLGKFVNEDHLVFYTRQKNGYGRLDYTPWVPAMLEPIERKRELDVPIVVLADVNSISMAEMTSMAVLTLPNGCVIGERTHGGIGQLNASNYAFDEFYGGYFAIPGENVNSPLLEVYTTMSMTKDINGNIYEGVGVPPTIEEPYDSLSLANGIDNQLERAVEYIRTGK